MNIALLLCRVVLTAMLAGTPGQKSSTTDQEAEYPEFVPPLIEPVSYLIKDPAVRSELQINPHQQAQLEQLCDQLDEHLFALRDAQPNPPEHEAIRHARAVETILLRLPKILDSVQQRRIEQLSLQYENIAAFFRPAAAAQLELTPEQNEKMQRVYQTNRKLQDELRRKLQAPEQEAELVDELEKLQFRQVRQMMQILSPAQLRIWQEMLGEPFDFSKTQSLAFRAPELREVTMWLNSPPLRMQDLRGRVLIVHFWTFGCADCQQNYPVYKLWASRYDPKEVILLGIHTPEFDREKDPAAVRQKMKEEALEFPTAVDNGRANWNAWANRLWPSVYLVDKEGRVRYWWYGRLRGQGATGDQWITDCIEQLRKEPNPK